MHLSDARRGKVDVMTDKQGPVEKELDTAAEQQVEKDQAEKAEKEKHPKPADHAETDKELAQKRGDAKERKSVDPA